MTLADYLKSSTNKLMQDGVATARLDSLIMLEDITGHDRSWLLAHPEAKISTSDIAKLNELLEQRASHEPLAYIRGKSEFYGRDFIITNSVLEPRPESETMIDMLKKLVAKHFDQQPINIADVGAGSGALGITAALEVPHAKVELLEIDSAAVKVAKSNVDKFTPPVKVIKSDLLLKTNCNYDILLCNLPYVPDDFNINLAATHEPRIAIFGGVDGLDIYRQLFLQLDSKTIKPLYILLESLPTQHSQLRKLLEQSGYEEIKQDHFIQLFKLK